MRCDTPILISDDDRNVHTALHLLFKNAGIRTAPAYSPEETIESLARERYALLLMDLNYQRDTTSGSEGLALLGRVRERWPDLPVVVMTGWGSIDLVVEAMRMRAHDFIEKPWENSRLVGLVQSLLSAPPPGRRSTEPSTPSIEPPVSMPWIANAPSMRRVMEIVDQVAGSDISILLTGENGTGKTQLASLIHARSTRAPGPFVSVNMSAIPDSLFESELYGHVKGAFTDARSSRSGRFEMAERGTLFMDEIGEMPHQQQAKLLHVLESRRFEKLGSSQSQQADVRIVSATNAQLPDLIERGRFRQDLLYRLRGIEIRVPALRERLEDIRALAAMYASHFARKYRRTTSTLEPRALSRLEAYHWPGNVRELSHVIERAVLLCRGDALRADDLDLGMARATEGGAGAAMSADLESWSDITLEDAEKRMLQLALRKHGGNASAAARALGLSRSAFYRRLDKHDC